MNRAEALAYYLTLTAYQRALETQLHLLRGNLRMMTRLGSRAEVRRMMANEITRVSLDNREVIFEIRAVAEEMNFPLPPALRAN